MTAAQSKLYWREWGAVRKAMQADQSWTGATADGFRARIHSEVLGYPKSSKDLTNAEFDKVLAAFRAMSRRMAPDQIEQLDQPRKRTRHALSVLVEELDLNQEYLEAMAKRICKRSVADLRERELGKLIAALNYHKQRLAKRGAPTGEDPF